MRKPTSELELPAEWPQIQSAIWLIGLAILAWRGWWTGAYTAVCPDCGTTSKALETPAAQQPQERA